VPRRVGCPREGSTPCRAAGWRCGRGSQNTLDAVAVAVAVALALALSAAPPVETGAGWRWPGRDGVIELGDGSGQQQPGQAIDALNCRKISVLWTRSSRPNAPWFRPHRTDGPSCRVSVHTHRLSITAQSEPLARSGGVGPHIGMSDSWQQALPPELLASTVRAASQGRSRATRPPRSDAARSRPARSRSRPVRRRSRRTVKRRLLLISHALMRASVLRSSHVRTRPNLPCPRPTPLTARPPAGAVSH